MEKHYQYGVRGIIGKTVRRSVAQSETVAVYVGTAPVHLLREYGGVINQPVEIADWDNALETVGYAADWDKFTLCEAIAQHFDNELGNIGPIYLINVLDPDKHRKDTATTLQVNFINGRASIFSDTAILKTIAIEDKVEGEDYSLEYDFEEGRVDILSLANPALEGQISVSYSEVDTTKVTYTDIIGEETEQGVRTGLYALHSMYISLNKRTNIIAAPGWSHIPEVYKTMVQLGSSPLNKHWYAFVNADIPLVDAGGAPVDTIEKCKAWKDSNGYNSVFSKPCWPMSMDTAGRKYHISSDVTYCMLSTDAANDGLPMETPANKPTNKKRCWFGDANPNTGFDERYAEELTKHGITTLTISNGQWVIWGDHTGAYIFGENTDILGNFDNNVRMTLHVINDFQYRNGVLVDKPLVRSMVGTILNDEQAILDALIARGALIGAPTISFVEENNPVDNIVEGYFRWDTAITGTPPAKSLTLYVAYTDEVYYSYYEGGAAA